MRQLDRRGWEAALHAGVWGARRIRDSGIRDADYDSATYEGAAVAALIASLFIMRRLSPADMAARLAILPAMVYHAVADETVKGQVGEAFSDPTFRAW